MHPQPERIAGPVRGYFIAAYAARTAKRSHSYVSYFKVFGARPQSYFDDAVILHKGSPHAAVDNAGAALEVAIRAATHLVSEWPEAGHPGINAGKGSSERAASLRGR
jgi:hypothetical protein